MSAEVGVVFRLARIIAALVLVAGCSSGSDTDAPASFGAAVLAGEPCDVLFDFRNAMDPSAPEVEDANAELRELGCHSRGDERQTTTTLNAASPACLAAAERAERIYATATNDQLIEAREHTLLECSTVDEWIAATREHPGAIGLVGGSPIGETDLWSCPDYPDTPVCRDLERR